MTRGSYDITGFCFCFVLFCALIGNNGFSGDERGKKRKRKSKKAKKQIYTKPTNDKEPWAMEIP